MNQQKTMQERSNMKKYDVVRIERIEGREKPNYVNVGIMLVKDDGKMSIKLNSVPVGNWDGWLNIFEKKEQSQKEAF
jgi:hypothetical protein